MHLVEEFMRKFLLRESVVGKEKYKDHEFFTYKKRREGLEGLFDVLDQLCQRILGQPLDES